jgi:hypothetical protein
MSNLSNELGELFGHNPQDRASQWDVDDPRPERGTMVPLYTRLMRSFPGDPCYYQAVTSTGPTSIQGLSNIVGARQAVVYVAGGNIIYRVDGSAPNAAGDQTVQEGSTMILTGKPTILGFQFASAVLGNATLYVTHYD